MKKIHKVELLCAGLTLYLDDDPFVCLSYARTLGLTPQDGDNIIFYFSREEFTGSTAVSIKRENRLFGPTITYTSNRLDSGCPTYTSFGKRIGQLFMADGDYTLYVKMEMEQTKTKL